MRIIILVLVLMAAAGALYLHFRNDPMDAEARAFYEGMHDAYAQGQPKALCAMADEQFDSVSIVKRGILPAVRRHRNKQRYCESLLAAYEDKRIIEPSTGKAPWEYEIAVQSVSVAFDMQSVTVRMHEKVSVDGTQRSYGESTDILVRRNGKLQLLKRDQWENFVSVSWQ